ncbi:Kelch repeat-containing protein [Flexithrix dorotheae]|uniref:Kelch repeat-containing protein n=1 Tax=Flexithrix dorotheae TaxID=70993 RepID=UPI000360D5D3|nr:hypothetical protein [Flexithrix dorotheae]
MDKLKNPVISFVLLILLFSCRENIFDLTAPTLLEAKLETISSNSARISGKISNLGPNPILQHGHCWSTNQAPTVSDSVFAIGEKNDIETYYSDLENLLPNTTYFVRPFAATAFQVHYGDAIQFETSPDLTPAKIAKTEILSVSEDNATLITKIEDLGANPIIGHGHCWSENQNPTIEDNLVNQGELDNEEDFESNLTGLKQATVYYLRPFVTTVYGTIYGDQISFMTPGWKKMDNLPFEARYGAVGFLKDNMIFIGTGNSSENQTLNDFWKYDIQNEVWEQVAFSPMGNVTECTGFAIENKGFMGTGLVNGNSRRRSVWAYNDEFNYWEWKEPLPSFDRNSAISFAHEKKGYLGLGERANNRFLDDFWEYNMEKNDWERLEDFEGESRKNAVTFVIGKKAYVGLGEGRNESFFKDFWEYDIENDQWEEINEFPGIERSSATAFTIGQKGYVMTGVDKEGNNLNDFWEFDPVSGEWTQLNSIPGENRQEAVGISTQTNGFLLTGKGEKGNALNDFYMYFPNTFPQ